VVRFLRAFVQDQRIEAEVFAQRSCDLCVATEVGLSAEDLYWDLFSDAVEVLDEKAFVSHHPSIVSVGFREQRAVVSEGQAVPAVCQEAPVGKDRRIAVAGYSHLEFQRRIHR
jgi:hypothetical protein